MFCKNCGQPIDPGAAICVKCGYQNGTGNNFCQNCGQPIAPGAAVCTTCGFAQVAPIPVEEQKSKLVAVLLALFLGGIGIHDFYLGYTQYGVIKIVLAICTFGVGSSIWALVDLIRLLTGSLNKDAKGIPLKKEF